MHELKVALSFLRQAQALCEGAHNLFEQDVDFSVRFKQIAAALEGESARIARLIATPDGAKLESETNGVQNQREFREDARSRIAQINAQLIDCERLSSQLDEMRARFEALSKSEAPEYEILKSQADSAEEILLERMGSLANVLTLERPATIREVLIFALRALAPLQELVMAVSQEHVYERKQGDVAYRLLQGMIPALELFARVTRAELGFNEEYYSGIGAQAEIEVIEKLRDALIQEQEGG